MVAEQERVPRRERRPGYLDPPFNSNADYNVLFREASGAASQAQFHAFTDTWSWADAAETYHQFIDTCPNVLSCIAF